MTVNRSFCLTGSLALVICVITHLILLVAGRIFAIVILGAADVPRVLRAVSTFVIAFCVIFAFAHFYTPFLLIIPV